MSGFTSQLLEDELILHDTTPEEWHRVPDDQSTGLDLSARPDEDYAYGAAADPFPSQLLIDPSEYQARIQEMEQTQSRISDLITLMNLPPKDQKQTNFCTTADTEVLTENGWKLWPEYNGHDPLGTYNVATGNLEYQTPLATQIFEHDGPMIYCTNRRLDFAVTPNHRMLLRKWDEAKRTLSPSFTFQEARNIGWYAGVPHSTKGWRGTDLVEVSIDGDRCYDGDDFVAMLGILASDGYAGASEKTKNWVSFCCFRADRYEQAAALAKRTGFTESPSRRGVWTRYGAGALAEWLRSKLYCAHPFSALTKRVPDIVKVASMRQIKIFLNFFGDKSHTRPENQTFSSSSKRMIDDLQELHLKIGKRGTISEQPEQMVHFALPGKEEYDSLCRKCYILTISHADKLAIQRRGQIETENYKGLVYCATVPNSTLITRRNNSVLISGNCWCNAPVHCLEIVRLQQNQPMVILSPASVACPINGFKNQGGWGKQALERIADKGVDPVSLWPANAIDRQYATAANATAALDYMVDKWFELKPRTIQQVMSMLLRRIPIACGLSWWGHEVTFCDPVWLDGAAAVRFRNSWGPSYGKNGFAILQGSKMLPDDACAPATAIAS